MGSNRDIAFVRNVLNRIAGIQYYAKAVTPDGDSLIVVLKRGTATNKATMIELRPDRQGQVNVTFMKGKPGEEVIVSEHPSTFFDGLAALLVREAGIITGERDKGEGAGLYRTSKW